MPVPMDHIHLPFFNIPQNKMVTPTSCMIDFQNMKDDMANRLWQAYKRAHPDPKPKPKKINIVKDIARKKK